MQSVRFSMLGTRSSNMSGVAIDNILSKIDAAITSFEEHLDTARYDDAERQGEIIFRLVKSLPRTSPHVTSVHKNSLGLSLERVNTALERFNIAKQDASPSRHNTAINAYSRFK